MEIQRARKPEKMKRIGGGFMPKQAPASRGK
jgi:hypothetical protein